MTSRQTIREFVENFIPEGDGFESADDVASGFFNSPATIDASGDVWLDGLGCWAPDDRLDDLAEYLRERES